MLHKSIVYKYDKAGNIILKKTYDYSLEDKLLSPVVDEYVYSCEGWRDQLIRFNGKEISYDEMGRPTTFKDDEFEWNNNNQLTYILTQNMDEIELFYDTNGIRRKKIVNGIETEYITNGSQIIYQIIKNGSKTETIIYRYALNKLIGFNYNNGSSSKEYIYLRNIQGDIIAIYDDDGNLVGEYAYDAYGNHKIITDVDGIASINPFRYRGYYFDEETGLFYCNSRYYSPELCRWLTPDSIEYLDPELINGLNLYAYCGNNPVNYYDPTGHSAIIIGLIIGAIIGAAIGFGAAAYIDYLDDGEIFNGSVEWYDYLGATILGGVIGASIGYIVPQIGGALSSFASTSFTFGGGLTYTASGGLAMATGLTITGTEIIQGVAALSGITIMSSVIGKSGGYRVEKNTIEHNPPHVHIFGDDIRDKIHGIRIGLDGKPLRGQQKLPPGARKALKRLWDIILKEFLK